MKSEDVEQFQLGVTTKGLISLIQSTLVDRYKDYFCIVQELLQNADDAGATTVLFGVHEQGLDADHPLAKLPGLFIVNNGPVSRANMEAIFSVAAGDKGSEKTKIGKFGLGMKSVFHACEGFFMFGEGHGNNLFPQFCTPWLGEYHKDWREKWLSSRESMSKQVAEIIGHHLPGLKQWFCVWLPLRTVESCGNISPIIGQYPDRSDWDAFAGREYAAAASRFLPMLKNVVDLRFLDVSGNKLQYKFSPRGRLVGSSAARLEGELKKDDGSITAYEYVGLESVDESSNYTKLKDSPRWPMRSEFLEGRGLVSYKDKTSPHVAVCILKEPDANASVTVSPCVFLPLSGVREDLERYSVACNGGDSYLVYLHGNFFVDAGRQDFDLGDAKHLMMLEPRDETHLRKAWNRTLFVKSVLPMLVQTLEEAALLWSGDSFDSFMMALPQVAYLKTWLGEITVKYRFLKELTVDGWQWRRIPSSDSVYSLAAPKGAAFASRLAVNLPSDVHLVDVSCGGLGATDSFPRDDERFVSAVFKAAEETPVNELLTDELRKFWAGFFIRFPAASGAFAFWKRIITTSRIRSCADFVKANRDLIAASNRNFTTLVGCKVTIKDTPIWISIVSAINNRIPLPDLEDIVCVSDDKVTVDDGRAILTAVEGMRATDRSSGVAYDFALRVAKVVGLKTLGPGACAARIWVVGDSYYSYDELIKYASELRFYRGKLESSEKSTFLSAVEWDLTRISPEEKREGVYDALGLEIPVLGPDLFTSILLRSPKLKGIAERRDLLKYLDKKRPASESDYRMAMRYLIHGSLALHGRTDKIYYPSPKLVDAFAHRALCEVSRAQLGAECNVSIEMVSALSAQTLQQLNFSEVDNDDLVRLLAETRGLNYDAFGASDWQSLLKIADSVYFNDGIKACLRRIPLFRTDDDRRVAIGSDGFLQGRPEVPEVFRNVVNVLPLSGDAEVDKRLALVARKWKYEDALEFSQRLGISGKSFADIVKPILRLIVSISHDNQRYVSSVPWVETTHGYVAPSQLLNLPGLHHVIEDDRLVYPDDVIDGDLWALLEKHDLLPNSTQSLKNLFEVLAGDPKYRIGEGSGLPEFSAANVLKYFEDESVMPVLPILKQCLECSFNVDAAIGVLRKRLSSQRYVDVVNYLTQRVKQGAKWLFPYLEEMVPCIRADRSLLGKLSVITQSLAVKPTTMVCTFASGVAKGHLLHKNYAEHAHEFFDLLCDNEKTVRPPSSRHQGTFEEYFRGWDPAFFERIAGFIYCCSDEKRDLDYAKIHLGLENRGSPDAWRQKICGELPNMMKGQVVRLWIYDTADVEVLSLTGAPLRLSLRELEPGDTLFYGEGNPCVFDPQPLMRGMALRSSQRRLELKLRKIKPETLKKSVGLIDEVLRNTLVTIVDRLCHQWMIDDSEFWTELSNVEQVDIAVTRDKLLEKADTYLPMLRCKDPHVTQHIRELDDLWYDIKTARKKPHGAELSKCLQRKEELHESLASVIEENPAVQANILSKIRAQMESYAYHKESILFELFQNADDAAEELRVLHPARQAGFKDRFEVVYDGKVLMVAHWGRRINQNKGSGEDARKSADFTKDLEKMLMLMQSGKDGSGADVTGKFGLGFKTVFFFSDEPIVISGRLRFKIVGGFLPKVLNDEELVRYQAMSERFNADRNDLRPTVFILPIKKDAHDMVVAAMDAFAQHQHFCAAFAHRIKSICLRYPNGKGVESDATSFGEDRKHFVVDTFDAGHKIGSVVAALQDGFVRELPLTTPTYWVTVPTRQVLNAGFVVNGKFDLDTGRSNLNRASEHNREMIVRFGRALYTGLKEQCLANARGDSRVGFFESIWIVFSGCKDMKIWGHDTSDLAKDIFWGEQSGGFRRFFSDHNILPSGLSGVYRCLCKVDDVEYVLSRGVADSPLVDVLGVAGLLPGRVVSPDLFPRGVRSFVDGFHAQEFGVRDFFTEALAKAGNFGPEMANGLPGEKLSEKLKEDGVRKEAEAFLNQVRFLSSDERTWRLANELVVDDGNESLIAEFAPLKSVLSSRYDAVGRAFFKAVRGHRRIPALELARLADAAVGDKRTAVLKYLIDAKDEETAKALTEDLRCAWLDGVPDMTWFKALSEEDRGWLCLLLGIDLSVAIGGSGEDKGFVGEPCLPIREVTADMIRAWWRDNSVRCIRKYNNTLYGSHEVLSPLGFDMNDRETRSAWLELFVIASAFSLGRTNECQHKGFIRSLKEWGFWDVYVDRDSSADDWIDTLEKFINKPAFAAQYQYWMRLFIRIYQFGRHLDGYVEYAQLWDEANVDQVMRLRQIKTNSDLSNSGIDLPDLVKAINDQGFSFLVRELIRRKALSNPALHRLIPMPKILGDETFGGAFDIAVDAFYDEYEDW